MNRNALHLMVTFGLFVVAADASARFVSVDPVQANANNGQDFNRYHYGNNNPYKFTDPDGRAVSCANNSCTMTSDTFNAAKSNGSTALASPDLKAAGNAAVPQFTVQSGSKESLGFFVPDASGKPVAQPAAGVQTGSKSGGNTASAAIPKGAMGVIHGHIDGGANKSNGMVDAPKLNGGYGDTQSLKAGIPTATVSQGQVGWHEINNGQLQFSYPQGALNNGQESQMQRNLNNEQKLFHIP
ncbi:hypothetical protein FZ025_14700 [Xanthomonas hyacinthi]|uniref:Uncharacterized protein n=1 Tax=Xanthomonas hyacinthi TaxID=56455 RepID=A0A2S7ENP0_9XANT|nr:hypothetical protein [Xanthomonas hyacinthi]PPU93225.1 hypothetical protein XhyaCFBP1156_20745 [Xanthomonas hyacinthi]QGY77827.1 hypothetical protein FZ025_14700 [Xanthomonas hyacinthi]